MARLKYAIRAVVCAVVPRSAYACAYANQLRTGVQRCKLHSLRHNMPDKALSSLKAALQRRGFTEVVVTQRSPRTGRYGSLHVYARPPEL